MLHWPITHVRQRRSRRKLERLQKEFSRAIAEINRPYPVILQILESYGITGQQRSQLKCPIHKYIWMRLSSLPPGSLQVDTEKITIYSPLGAVAPVTIADTDLSQFIRDFDMRYHLGLITPGSQPAADPPPGEQVDEVSPQGLPTDSCLEVLAL